MRFFQITSYGLWAFLAAVEALTITEPSENTVINPQQSFTIRWTSTPGDPQTLTFSITGAGDFSILQYQEIATNVQTSAGSVEVPANTVGTYGQYKIEGRDASTSSVLTTSPGFYLAQGNDQTMSITSNGGATPTIVSENSQISTVTGENGTSIILSGTREPSTHPSLTSATNAGSSATSAAPSETSNAQSRLGGDGNTMVLGLAGVMAGLVALIA